jgi:PAS domain S-box-containing protein
MRRGRSSANGARERKAASRIREIEIARDELRTQNIQMIKNAIELSDLMRRLEDKNYDLMRFQSTLEEQVAERTESLRVINRKLVDEIREKSRTQVALRESEEHYRSVFENSGTAIFIIEPDMRVSMANTKCYDLTGVPGREIAKGMLWTRFVADPEMLEKMKGYHQARRANPGSAPIEYEFTLRHADGSIKDVLLYVNTIEGTEKSVASMIDITHRRRAERENLELEKKLQHSQKMEAIGTLAGGIAHDFNNILTAVMGYTDMALAKVPPEGPIANWLRHSLDASMRARDLVVQILTFCRRNDQEIRTFRLAPVIMETLKFLRASIPKTIGFDVTITCDKALVTGDPTQVQQVVMNLCTNAAHAMGDNAGRLGVCLRNLSLDPSEVRIKGLDGERFLELTISDTGQGIDPSIIHQIFDPFFTTKSVGEGTGMGLAMTYGIIQRMGGWIGVDSVPGRGTVFTVIWPEGRGVEDGPVTEHQEKQGQGETVLLVDDDPQVLEVMDEMVRLLGYRVVPMSGSPEALRAFEAAPDRFDLVVTDRTMPEINGIDLAAKIRAIRGDIPIIMCTGFSDSMDHDAASVKGLAAILMKPVDRVKLSRTIHDALSASSC